MFEENETALWFRPCVRNSTPKPPWPLIVFLHGIGERGTPGLVTGTLEAVARWGLPKLRAKGQAVMSPTDHGSFPFLVIAPQCPLDRTWCDPDMLQRLDGLIDQLVSDGTVDRRRLYLTGFSMGGIGTFCAALHRPHRFAAIAPVCGRCTAPHELQRLAHLPVWIAYAEDDEVADLSEGSEQAIRLLQPYGRLESRAYRLGAEGGLAAHVRTADQAYREPDLYTWLLSHAT